MSPQHLYFWRCSIFGDGGSFDRHQWAYVDIFWPSPMSFIHVAFPPPISSTDLPSSSVLLFCILCFLVASISKAIFITIGFSLKLWLISPLGMWETFLFPLSCKGFLPYTIITSIFSSFCGVTCEVSVILNGSRGLETLWQLFHESSSFQWNVPLSHWKRIIAYLFLQIPWGLYRLNSRVPNENFSSAFPSYQWLSGSLSHTIQFTLEELAKVLSSSCAKKLITLWWDDMILIAWITCR